MSQDAPQPVVLLVEDKALVRLKLGEMLEDSGYRVLSVVSAEEALEVLGHAPNINIMVTDVELSSTGMNGFELAQKVREEYGLAALVLSGQIGPGQDDLPSEAHLTAKLMHQATLTRLVHDVVEDQTSSNQRSVRNAPEPNPPASRRAPEREYPVSHKTPNVAAKAEWGLTPRQHEVLGLLVQGKSNREIAEAMGLSENTVKVHLVSIYRVLGVSSRTEALLAGMKRLRTD